MPFDLTPENAARFSREASALVRGYIAAQNDVFKFSFMRALGLKKPDAAKAAADAAKAKAADDARIAAEAKVLAEKEAAAEARAAEAVKAAEAAKAAEKAKAAEVGNE